MKILCWNNSDIIPWISFLHFYVFSTERPVPDLHRVTWPLMYSFLSLYWSFFCCFFLLMFTCMGTLIGSLFIQLSSQSIIWEFVTYTTIHSSAILSPGLLQCLPVVNISQWWQFSPRGIILPLFRFPLILDFLSLQFLLFYHTTHFPLYLYL